LPHIRIVPHLDNTLSLHFKVIDLTLPDKVYVKIGRSTGKTIGKDRIAFKSKVVSRDHAEIWTENGKFYIRDTGSSSGTFVNHARISQAKLTSQPYVLEDGVIVQLGVNYQGGTEEIYRSVKMRVEINRNWQKHANIYNESTFQNLRTIISPSNQISSSDEASPQTVKNTEESSDCCICLCAISPVQALFISPCSHIFHFRCIRPLLQQHYPGFNCPLCRTYTDLEENDEVDDYVKIAKVAVAATTPATTITTTTTSSSLLAGSATPLSTPGIGEQSSSSSDCDMCNDDASASPYSINGTSSQPQSPGLKQPRSAMGKFATYFEKKRLRNNSNSGKAHFLSHPQNPDEGIVIVSSPQEGSSSSIPISSSAVNDASSTVPVGSPSSVASLNFAVPIDELQDQGITPTEELHNPTDGASGGGKGKERANYHDAAEGSMV